MEISTAKLANYLELVLDAYFDAVDFPDSENSKIERHLELLQNVKSFTDGWKKSGLPRNEMVVGFRNPLVRELILAGMTLSEEDVAKYLQEWDKLCEPSISIRI